MPAEITERKLRGRSCSVDFFFVLSGFIIFGAHRDDISKPRSLPSYLTKRFIWIYPTFWMIFAAVFLGAWVVPSLRSTLPSDAGIVLKTLLLLPQHGGSPVIVVAWSLQYEVLFYLFFALLVLDKWVACHQRLENRQNPTV